MVGTDEKSTSSLFLVYNKQINEWQLTQTLSKIRFIFRVSDLQLTHQWTELYRVIHCAVITQMSSALTSSYSQSIQLRNASRANNKLICVTRHIRSLVIVAGFENDKQAFRHYFWLKCCINDVQIIDMYVYTKLPVYQMHLIEWFLKICYQQQQKNKESGEGTSSADVPQNKT